MAPRRFLFRASAVLALVALWAPPASARPDFRLGVGVRDPGVLDHAGDLAGSAPFVVRVPLPWAASAEEMESSLAIIRSAASHSGWTVQVNLRYQPPPDVAVPARPAAFGEWVGVVVSRLAGLPGISFDVTNRPNSPDLSGDGGRVGVMDALVTGVRAGKRAAAGRAPVGFSFLATGVPAWDVSWWVRLGLTAGPDFASQVDFVDVQLYPGSHSASTPWAAGGPGPWAVAQLDQVRGTLMPILGLDPSVPLWAGEIGFGVLRYPVPLYGDVPDADMALRTEWMQAQVLDEMLNALARVAADYNLVGVVWWALDDADGCPATLCHGLITDSGRRRTAFGYLCLRLAVIERSDPPCLTS